MRAGPLRDRVAVQSASTSADSFGQLQPSWSTVGTYWADVSPLSGREAERARQVRADASHVVTFRQPTTITPLNRLTFGSQTFNVVEVQEIGHSQGWKVVVAEILTGATP